MKNITKKLSAFSLTAILLLAGCGIHQQDDIDLSVDLTTTTSEQAVQTTSENNKKPNKPEITTHKETTGQTQNTEPEETFPDCFIAPNYEDEYMVELYNSYDCEPGYLYFKVIGSAEDRLLLNRKFKRIGTFQTTKEFYGVTEENELLKVDKSDGSYEVIYTAQNGNISQFEYTMLVSTRDGEEVYEEGRLLYVVDGNDIVIMERETEKHEVVHCDNGVSDIYYAGFQEENTSFIDNDDVYICDECGYDGNYVIWEDNDGNYFWYHPETGENEPLKLGEKTINTYFVKAD